MSLDTSGIDDILNGHERRLSMVVRAYSFAIQGLAAMIAPYKTGALSNSIHVLIHSPLYTWVQDGVLYGIYQELGTSRNAAHPFMIPAAEHYRESYWRALVGAAFDL